MVAVLGYSRGQIVDAVQAMYTEVADAPAGAFHFPVGREAAERLGYDPARLDRVPAEILASFAGVGCPFLANAIRPGDVVLDLGAGSGVDTVLALEATGPTGQVIACDLTWAMLGKLDRSLQDARRHRLRVLQASAEALPLPDGSVDVISSNGALNLVPDKRRAIAEMVRVLHPGGRVQLADVVIRRPVTVDCTEDPRLWVECIVGATVDEELLRMLADAGFEAIRVLRRHDYFALSPSVQTREIAASFHAQAMELSMRRAEQPPGRLLRWLRHADPRRAFDWLRRRGFIGVAALLLAVLSCYGALAAVGALAALGVGLAVNQTAWAGTVLAFSLAATGAVLAGARRHRRFGPSLAALAGISTIGYALLVDYRALVEFAGFTLLACAVIGDVILRRRREARMLGVAGQR